MWVIILWVILLCNTVNAQNVVISTDSNLINIQPLKGNTTDSVKAKLKTDTTVKEKFLTRIFKKNDSLSFKKKITNKTSARGSVSMGYDYGIIPFTTNMKIPEGFYSTTGTAGFKVLGFPIDVSFYYSTIKSVSGLNNYFKISYDVNQYKENLKNDVNGKIKIYTKNLDSLTRGKQTAEQRKLYMESMSGSIDTQISSEQYLNYKGMYSIPEVPDTGGLSPSFDFQIPDSIKNKEKINEGEMPDSKTHLLKTKNDSIEYYKNLLKKSDSLKSMVSEYENKINGFTEEIDKVKKIIDELKNIQNPNPSMVTSNDHISKYKQMLFTVKTFEIGMCYPNYSTFLVKGATVNGINVEVEKPYLYYAFTYGKTINTLMMNNNILQNSMQKITNMLDFFDFNDVSTSRRITVFKIGYGKKDATHIHAGVLYGSGLTSYMEDVSEFNVTQNKERNYVIELEGRWAINSNNTIDLVYGKSSVQQADQSFSTYEKGFYGVFQKVRSNAALAAYKTSIKRTKTKMTFTSRWIDPFFKSYGVGFLRADNFRYEIKAEQPISKKIKLTGSYRKGEDNLLSLYNYKSTIRTIGAKISIKFTRCWSMQLGYNPILQKIRTAENINIINRNNITTGVITYTPKAKKFTSVFNLLYSYYSISDSVRNNIFRNINFTGSSQISKSFNNYASAGWLYANSTDSINTNTLLFADEISYTLFKRAELSVIGKYAITPGTVGQPGYGIKIDVPLINRLSAEGSFERIVFGDFYSCYDAKQLKKFPYYSYVKLIYTW
jgi:hypothetical protein